MYTYVAKLASYKHNIKLNLPKLESNNSTIASYVYH